MVMMSSVSIGGHGPPYPSPEIINCLFKIVMGFRLPCAFDKTGSIDRSVVGSPMTPGARRRVGIVANQGETLGSRGCIKALQSRRSRSNRDSARHG